MSAPKLSVVIVNHNAKRFTVNCLASVAEKTTVPHEIVLVDNASSDDVLTEVGARFPDVRIITNERNAGFAHANNQGMQAARGSYVILLNNDTILKNAALDRMAAFLDAHEHVGALACKLYDGDGVTIQHNCRAFPAPLDTLFSRASLLTRLLPNNPRSARNLVKDFDYQSVREVDWVSGAALMTRRATIDDVGLLDDQLYYMYWEDTDWCRRLRGRGWTVYFTPDAEIIHYGGQGGTRLESLPHNVSMMFHKHYSAYKYFRKFDFRSSWHPMAIAIFAGMIVLVGVKAVVEAVRAVLGRGGLTK